MDSTVSSSSSLTNSLNETFTKRQSSDEKENQPFTPYYKRMTTLLNPGKLNCNVLSMSSLRICFFSLEYCVVYATICPICLKNITFPFSLFLHLFAFFLHADC